MVRYYPQFGWKSWYTQKIANNLPPWHVIRTDPAATGQLMINTWAMAYEDLAWELDNNRKNLYPTTADTMVRSYAYTLPVPEEIVVYEDPRTNNLLINSGMVYEGPAYRKIPLEFQATGGEIYFSDVRDGNACYMFSDTGYIYQEQDVELEANQLITGSVYLKNQLTPTTNTGSYLIKLSVRTIDNAWEETTAQLPYGTAGEWVRASVAHTPTDDVNKLKLTVELGGAVSAMKVANPQVEVGVATSWQPNLLDIDKAPFRIRMAGPTGEVQTGLELRYTNNLYEFFEDALPTRATLAAGNAGTTISTVYGPPKEEFDGSLWYSYFRVSGEYIERYNAEPDLVTEVFNTYSIRDRYPDNVASTGEYGVIPDEEADFSRTLEALTAFRKKIYLMCLETKGAVTQRILKILEWTGGDDYLETIADLRVGLDTGEVTSIGFIDGDFTKMAIDLSGSDYTLNLYYDYYNYDPIRREVDVRHSYTGYVPTIMSLDGTEATGELEYFDVWNHWDDFGLLLDLARIPEETMPDYRLRLLDVFMHRAGPTQLGIVHGVNRELGFDVHDSAIIVQPYKRGDGQPVVRDATISVRSDGIIIGSAVFYITDETHKVRLDTLNVTLTYPIHDGGVIVRDASGNRLSRSSYKIDLINNKLIFHQDYAGDTLTFIYKYLKRVDLDQAMSGVVTDLNGIYTPSGNRVLTATLSSSMVGTETGEGMVLTEPRFVNDHWFTETGDYYNQQHLAWGECWVRSMGDEWFIKDNLSTDGTFYGSPLERWVEQLRDIANVTWNQLRFDKQRWNNNMGLSVVPTLADGHVGYWTASDPTLVGEFDSPTAAGFNMEYPGDESTLKLKGLGPNNMLSGIAGGDALKVIVDEDELPYQFTSTIYSEIAGLYLDNETPTGEFYSLLVSGEM